METKKIQDGAFFLSFVVIRYEQREVSRQTICRWENGSRCPDLITAKKLALELKVSMDEQISDEACRIFRLIMESGNQKK